MIVLFPPMKEAHRPGWLRVNHYPVRRIFRPRISLAAGAGVFSFGSVQMAESKLPGRPRVSLVKKVKAILRLYFSAVPGEWGTNWRATWLWADAIRWKTPHFGKGSPPWPSATEIATQYVLLCLTSMRDGTGLMLHYKAVEAMPEGISLRLATTQQALAFVPETQKAPETANL